MLWAYESGKTKKFPKRKEGRKEKKGEGIICRLLQQTITYVSSIKVRIFIGQTNFFSGLRRSFCELIVSGTWIIRY